MPGRARPSTAASPTSTAASIRQTRARARARRDCRIPTRKLRPGMLLRVQVQLPSRQALVLPELAVQQEAEQGFVFRVGAGDKVEQVPVKLGARRAGRVEVVVRPEGRRPRGGRRHGQAACRQPRSSKRGDAAQARREARDAPMKLSDLSIHRPVLRDRGQPAADRARRDRVHAPAAARTAGHRSAGGVDQHHLYRRLGGGDGNPRHPGARGCGVAASRASTRSSRTARTARSRINIEFTLQRDIESAANDVRDAVSRSRSTSCPTRPIRRRSRKVVQRFGRDPVVQPQRPGHGHAGADRLRRALPGRPPVDASTAWRRSSSAARRTTRCGSGSTATRWPRAA